MKKTHLTVILAAIFCCAVMSLIDGVIRPGYAVKSAIKIALFLGIPVLLAREPMDCAALGLGNIIENYELLQHLGRTSFLKPF